MKHKAGVIAAAVAATVLVAGGSAGAASLITSKQIQDGTIQKRDLSPQTVTALKGQRGPAGPQGSAGPQGPAGSQGPAGQNGSIRGTVVRSNASAPVDPGGQGTAVVLCQPGEFLTGGGARSGAPHLFDFVFNAPLVGVPNAWAVVGVNTRGQEDATFTADAICAS